MIDKHYRFGELSNRNQIYKLSLFHTRCYAKKKRKKKAPNICPFISPQFPPSKSFPKAMAFLSSPNIFLYGFPAFGGFFCNSLYSQHGGPKPLLRTFNKAFFSFSGFTTFLDECYTLLNSDLRR